MNNKLVLIYRLIALFVPFLIVGLMSGFHILESLRSRAILSGVNDAS